ncbi:LINE-1 retrotransposable element ORF1 protein [Plecturocebus cupreus]
MSIVIFIALWEAEAGESSVVRMANMVKRFIYQKYKNYPDAVRQGFTMLARMVSISGTCDCLPRPPKVLELQANRILAMCCQSCFGLTTRGLNHRWPEDPQLDDKALGHLAARSCSGVGVTLESSGAITAHCRLNFPGLSDPPTSPPQVAETTGMHHYVRLIFVFFVEMRFTMLASLVSNSWAQVTHLPWLPRLLHTNANARLTSLRSSSEGCKLQDWYQHPPNSTDECQVLKQHRKSLTACCGLNYASSLPRRGSRAWSGPQQSYSRGARLLEGKLRNRNNFIINKLDIHSEAQSESQQLQRRQEDKYTKMGRNQHKKDENTRNQNTSPPTRDHNSSPAREQGWTEMECDEMTESGLRRWVIRNFCELKEHVLTQCKETKNLEKRFDEMLTRMDNLGI